MSTVDLQLQDEVLAHSLDLFRLSAGEQAKVVAVLEDLEKELTAKLSSAVLTSQSKSDLSRLLDQIEQLTTEYYARAGLVGNLGAALGSHVADVTAASIRAVVPAVGVTLPTDTVMAAAVQDVVVQGAPASAWWAKQGEDTFFKFAAQIRQGVAAAETNQQIIRRIAGTRGAPGVMDIARRNAAALVQTSVASIANEARQLTYDANGDIIDEVRWLTALDGHVCHVCASYAGLRWKLEDKAPVGHRKIFRQPPIHFNDRCVLVPITKTFAEMGLNLPEFSPTTRAQAGQGQVSAKIEFDDFLKRKGVAFQNDVLGDGRAELWRAGKITLQDLTNGRGRELTLAELIAKAAKK